MEHAFYYRLSNILWKAIVCVIVVLAMYVSFGGFIMSRVSSQGDDILQRLNERSPFLIEAKEVTGTWHSFTPEIVLTNLRLTLPGSDEPPLELAEGRVAIDVWQSLRTRSLQTFRLSLDQLSLRGTLREDGRILIAGLGGGDSGNIRSSLEQFLLNIEQLNLTNNELFLDLPDGSDRTFDLNLALRREGSFRRLEAKLVSKASGTQIVILGQGLGNPADRKAFSGDFYLTAYNPDLTEIRQFLPPDLDVQLSGEASLQAWFSWHDDQPTIEAEFSGENLLLEDTAKGWQIPLERLSLRTSVQQRSDHWSVFGSDFVLQSAGESVQLPRFQFDFWGDSIRLRTADIAVAPLSKLLLGLEISSGKLADVFRALDPQGDVQSLELSVADYHEPGFDWQLKANFSELAVQSWRGAPGITSAVGYAQLQPGGGFVILDSHQFSMDFPTVYRQPLRFDDFYGTIDIAWNSSEVALSSGVILAEGIEGTATARFGLNIPLQPSNVGLEMELSVGLRNTHPIHRAKYLPYTLNDALLGWLKGSIGEGKIEESGFLWRGSLKPRASALRTVQLFFNVTDTRLNYFPNWPAISALEGIVLIDDAKVSVWSENAKLYNSKLNYLSAETWLNDDKQIVLAIASRVDGDAADGLQVINESPIGKVVNGAFSDWVLTGGLDTQLDLQLNLNDSSIAPLVRVDTLLRDANLSINPGKLKVDQLNGLLSYSSEEGFSSSDLQGSVWGHPLQAQVRQAAVDTDTEGKSASRPYKAGSSTTEVALSTLIDLEDIASWLNLDILSLAQGETATNLLIEIPPGRTPQLTISSDLAGVSLDLPDPWRKSAESVQALKLLVPLSGESRVLDLNLNSALYLQILLSGAAFDGLSLGFHRPPAQLSSGSVHVSGHTSLLDQAQWQKFLEDYVYADFITTPPPAETAQIELAATGVARPGLDILIEELKVDTLKLFGETIQDVVFSLEMTEGRTALLADTNWLSGELLLEKSSSMAELSVAHLDLSALDQLSFESVGSNSLELLHLDVVAKNLSYGGDSLGELAFTVRPDGESLNVENIVGKFAGLELQAENSGSLLWRRQDGQSETQLKAPLVFQDLGQTLQQLSYQNIVETSGGKFDLELNWPGGPSEFSLATARGALAVNIAEGRFLDTPGGASGTLKVVGILNLADIVQRSSLNLSDMFESGIPFHSIEGEVHFHGGSIEVPQMDVKGRSSSFQFSAVSDIKAKSLDGELIATLPVANNLPWVAALAMGLPVAAGVFVVSKVFEKQVNRFSSAVYELSGSWEEPQVKFDRIFDTSSDRKIIVPEADTTQAGQISAGPERSELPIVAELDPNAPAIARSEVSIVDYGDGRAEVDEDVIVDEPDSTTDNP